ncbi:MAG: hypothetical protein CME70_08550 [Halobacteriovorax sp.]|nr:hypothetical protein [Halobacteriovorax sp.]
MAEILMVTEIFLLSLAFGVSLFTPIANSKLTGNGFVKLIITVALVPLFLSTLLNLRYASLTSFPSILHYIPMVCMVLVRFFHEDEKSILMWILYAVQNICLLVLFFITFNHHWPTFLYFMSSMGLLGIITYAMVLGHYYLVVPKLTVRPLQIANIILWVIISIKIAQAGIFVFDNLDFYEAGTMKGAGYSFNWLMLLMRAGWGYLVIGVMSIFNWKLLKLRSTQSATGMLYAMTFFVIIGELCAQYMYFGYGMFL